MGQPVRTIANNIGIKLEAVSLRIELLYFHFGEIMQKLRTGKDKRSGMAQRGARGRR